MKNIFESRQLQGSETDLILSVNIDEYGKFYALSLFPHEHSRLKWEADNEDWIINTLYPALENWLYNEEPIPAEIEEQIKPLSREERIGIFEMVGNAMVLGWVSKQN